MRISAADKAHLYREFAKLVGADFHLDRAVDMLLGQKPSAARHEFLAGLQRGLGRGEGIAKAMEVENAGLASGLEVSLVTAGERSGKLAQAFDHLSRYFSALEAGLRQARGALIYPLLLVHLAIVLPEIPAAISGQGEHSIAVAILTKIGGLWLAAIVLTLIWKALAAAAVKSAAIDGLLRCLPLVGGVRRHWALARFSQVYHAGLLAALRMSEITRIAGDASQSGVMRAGADRAAARIEGGERLAAALAGTGAFPRIYTDGIATAEESGTLDREMERWAEVETDRASEGMKRLAEWLPRVVYALVLIYVVYRILGMVYGIYAPVFRQMEEMGI